MHDRAEVVGPEHRPHLVELVDLVGEDVVEVGKRKRIGVNLVQILEAEPLRRETRGERLGARVVPFEAGDVVPVAHIRAATRSAGLSLGDRACLALAQRLGWPALTADRQWRDIQVDIEVRMIRD